MTPPGKSAALRRPRHEDDEGAAGSEAVGIPSRATSSRDKLLAFPAFEARPAQRRADPAPATEPTPAPDLGAELEAALMSDLQSMVELFDQAAREPAPRAAAASAPAASAADPDQEALERLLISIRQGDGAARPASVPAEEPPVAEIPVEIPAPRPARTRRETSPRPSGRSERMAPPSRPRKPQAEKQAAGKLAPALQLGIPGARRAYLKPALAASVLILLAAIGAGMTIRALTARNDTAPAASKVAAETAPAVPPAPVEAATPPQPSEPPRMVARAVETAAAPEAASPSLDAASQQARATAAPQLPPAPEAAPLTLVAPSPAAAPETAQPAEATTPDLSAGAPPVALDFGAAANAAEQSATAATSAPSEPQVSAAEPVAAAPKPAEPMVSRPALQPGAARIANGVKLRTNPDNGAPVIGLLGPGAAVEIVSCKGWCEVVAGDKRGFVFQKFLTQSGG